MELVKCLKCGVKGRAGGKCVKCSKYIPIPAPAVETITYDSKDFGIDDSKEIMYDGDEASIEYEGDDE